MKRKIGILSIIFIIFSGISFAQTGTIEGNILNEEGISIPMATVKVTSGISNIVVAADINGHFKLKPLEAGKYNIEASSMSMHSKTIIGIIVRPDNISFVDDIQLLPDAYLIDSAALVIAYREKIIDPENTSKLPINKDLIIKLPGAKNPVDIAASLSTEISKDNNNQMIVRGSRPGSSNVYIDGVKVENSGSKIPNLAVGGMEIYTGGVPAKYGDFTGGVVIMRSVSYFDLLSDYNNR